MAMVIEIPGIALKISPTMRPGTIHPQDPTELAMIPNAPKRAAMSIIGTSEYGGDHGIRHERAEPVHRDARDGEGIDSERDWPPLAANEHRGESEQPDRDVETEKIQREHEQPEGDAESGHACQRPELRWKGGCERIVRGGLLRRYLLIG